MTERMQAYRERMEEKGLVQVRIWVEKQDEDFVKYIAKFCREVREKKKKSGTAVEQVSSKLNLRKLSPGQKMFLNQSIYMIITSVLPGGHGVMGLASKLRLNLKPMRIKTKNIPLKAVGQTSASAGAV